LAKLFNEQKKTKTDVFTNDRSMGKLFKEAEKLKKVLFIPDTIITNQRKLYWWGNG
jgi:hypothetical protein